MKPPIDPSTLPGLRNSRMHSTFASPATQPPTTVAPVVANGAPAPTSGKHVLSPPPQQPEMSGSNLGSPAQPASAVTPLPSGGSQGTDSPLKSLSSGSPKPPTSATSPSAPTPSTAVVDLPAADGPLLSPDYILPALHEFDDPNTASDAAEAFINHAQALKEHSVALARQRGSHEPSEHLPPSQRWKQAVVNPLRDFPHDTTQTQDSTSPQSQRDDNLDSAELPMPPRPSGKQHAALSGGVLKSMDELRSVKEQLCASQAEGGKRTEAAEKNLESTRQDYSQHVVDSNATIQSLIQEAAQAKSRANEAEEKNRRLEHELRQVREIVRILDKKTAGPSGPLLHQTQPPPTHSAVKRNPEYFANNIKLRTDNMLELGSNTSEVRVVTSGPKPKSVKDEYTNNCCTVQ